MFDFDAGKLLVIGIVALIVIGPKELPRVLRQVGQTVGKLRRMAAEFQSQFMDAVKEAELEDIRGDLTKMAEQSKIDTAFNPLHTIRREITQALSDKTAGNRPEEVPSTELTPAKTAGAEMALGETAPSEVNGAPCLGLVGLSDASDLRGADFVEAAIAPVAEHAAPTIEPAPEPVGVAPSAPAPSEPSPLGKMGET